MLLHGYDAGEHDVAALGPLIDPSAHFLVHAPRGPVEVPDGTGGAWYRHAPRGPDPETFAASVAALHADLDRLCRDHLMGRGEVVLGGFSQGAAMALALSFGASAHPPPAGVICWSGFLVDVDGFDYDWGRAPQVSVLVQHGRDDEMVPVDLGADSARLLAHEGAPVTYHEYDMGHRTSLESLADARDWLERVRQGERPSEPAP